MNDAATAFRNEPVDPAALPDFSTVPLQPVIRGYTIYSVVVHGVVGPVVAIVAGVALGLIVNARTGLLVAVPTLVVLTAWLALYGWLSARRFGWAIRDHDVITHGGVLWRKSVVLPLVRIQHVETASGPVERAFGTRRVQAFSAASGSADLIVYGLTPDRAQQVRAYLLDRIGQGDGGDDRD